MLTWGGDQYGDYIRQRYTYIERWADVNLHIYGCYAHRLSDSSRSRSSVSLLLAE